MDDQITCIFIFRITPISITQNILKQSKVLDANTKKNQQSILFKLGSTEGKSSKLGDSVEIKTSVLYSKTLNKFCPIKGLVKIYDKNKDGSEMISCVGAFNTDQLLNNQKCPASKLTESSQNQIQITRSVGPSILTMRVSVRRQSISNPQNANRSQSLKKIENRSQSQNKANSQGRKSTIQVNEQASLVSYKKDKKAYQNISQPIWNNASNKFSSDVSISGATQLDEEYRNNEQRMIAQQLVQQRRLTRSLEQKLQQTQLQCHYITKKLSSKQSELHNFVLQLKKFTELIDLTKKIEISPVKQEIGLKYNRNKENVREEFMEFFTFVKNKIIEDELNFGGKDKDKEKGEIESGKQLANLRLIVKEKDKKIVGLEHSIIKKNQQILVLQTKLRKSAQDRKILEGINQYLQEKDTQMQSIIAQKEQQIQSLKKANAANNQQLDLFEDKNRQQNRIIENLQYIIEQTKEEVANLSETIENYRKKYGDLKEVKDRALERDLRECLHWIEQYRTEQLSEIGEQTTNNSINMLNNNSNSNINVDSDSNNSMTSFMMKSIDQIQEMPLQEISHIRREVVGVLKRLDQFLARNTL